MYPRPRTLHATLNNSPNGVPGKCPDHTKLDSDDHCGRRGSGLRNDLFCEQVRAGLWLLNVSRLHQLHPFLTQPFVGKTYRRRTMSPFRRNVVPLRPGPSKARQGRMSLIAIYDQHPSATRAHGNANVTQVRIVHRVTSTPTHVLAGTLTGDIRRGPARYPHAPCSTRRAAIHEQSRSAARASGFSVDIVQEKVRRTVWDEMTRTAYACLSWQTTGA
ncbi:uncharacterized protein B0H18DRAFT_274982 [Fomitopsis serialis]|uniref:uncharacterized protein n=1 Tax=Fomitopsis serialis TaxID=139415 RepID=UPI00200814CB|nr:uncharacterized protein B0H18DRAFT_274982 [Neoantrodia serialis]KAH9912128.1 hypothetical protein B0H18DRAFT_274982 [Neoantrodia serialis]